MASSSRLPRASGSRSRQGRGRRRWSRHAACRGAATCWPHWWPRAAEARSAFGDGAVYLEREIRPARHIEVQLLGDDGGDVVALGERDCSIQSRHQKLVEERRRRTDDRRATGSSRDGRPGGGRPGCPNASTAEFLFDGDRGFWFLEVNAGSRYRARRDRAFVDRPRPRRRTAVCRRRSCYPSRYGRPPRAPAPGRHAIEVRLAAEDPASGSHRCRTYRTYGDALRSGVGSDTAIRPGDHVPPDYDPMIAKIMAVGHRIGGPPSIESDEHSTRWS